MNGSHASAHLEDLVTFLAVARLGSFTAAGSTLGINHSTVSRRIGDLEKKVGGKILSRGDAGWVVTELGSGLVDIAERVELLGQELDAVSKAKDAQKLNGVVRLAAPDAFTTFLAIPALAKLQKSEPRLLVEIMTATQQVRQRRSGVDVEIVVGEPRVNRARSYKILDYQLKLYATEEYLRRESIPASLDDLRTHRLNYYIESALQVNDLDIGAHRIPSYIPGISSTSVFAHVSSTVSGAGIGLLPTFVAPYCDLVPVLHDSFEHNVSYWAVVRNENLRNPIVRATLKALVAEARSSRFEKLSPSEDH